MDTTQPIVELAKGFGGDIGPAEGPLWWKEGGYLLFNDINAARRMKYTPRQGVTVAMEKTNEANGLTRDLQGRIVSAEHLTRRVTRTEPDGSITVVANSFQGKRLLRPNDVVVKSDGAMYFTDPGGPLAPDQWDVTSTGVYRVSADLGSMSLLTDEMFGPNGIAFSPDESDSLRQRLAPAPHQSVRHASERRDRQADEPGLRRPRRIGAWRCGRHQGGQRRQCLFGGAGGLYILDAKGKKLGRIVHGEAATTNMAFGGDDWKTLYFTTRSTLYMVNLKVAGIPVPVGRKSA